MRMDCEMNLKVGTSLKIRSNVGLSSVMACWALSLTLPLDHFFFFADLPPPDEDGAGALALGGCETRESRCQDPFRRKLIRAKGRHPLESNRETGPQSMIESMWVPAGVGTAKNVEGMLTILAAEGGRMEGRWD
jgi:hypothetical protein